MPNNSLGERLKEERERLGYTQTAFADFVGASKRTQIGWEQGRSVPDANALARWVEDGLDASFVLTGQRSNVALTHHLPPDEQLLLEAYRGLTAPARKALLADLLTGGKKTITRRKPASEEAGIKVSGSGHRVAGRDYREKE